MSKIVPAEYVLTDEAIDELVGADPHFRRLKADWLAADGKAKDKAYIDVGERQNQITDQLFAAVTAHRLQPIALQRTAAGEWVEYAIPRRYRETLGGELALWRGSASKIELEAGDEWLRRAPLCFRRPEFNEWVASAIVVRPLGAEDIPTWWTIPEAAVWIATRKLTSVKSLDMRARASLFVASEVVSGTYEASFELLAGLRAGRLQARGWPRNQPSAVASRVIPSDFWKAPTEFSDGETGVEGWRGHGDAMVGLLLESDEVMAKWESPRSLLDGERIPLGVAVGRLMHESLSGYLLRHEEICVTGLNASGQRVEIDKDVFWTNAMIDRAAHSVRTADGRLHWSAVMVELRETAEAAPPKPAPLQLIDEAQALTWVKEIVGRMVSDGLQLRRGDFDAMLRQQYADRLAPKMVDRLWHAGTPDDWRKPNQGRLPDRKVVSDWRSYLTPLPPEKGPILSR